MMTDLLQTWRLGWIIATRSREQMMTGRNMPADDEDATRLAALRAAVQVGIDAMERGDFVSFDDDESLDAHLDAIAEQAIRRHKTP